MPANIGFVDSNVILYAYSNDQHKKSIAKSLLKKYPIISTQVINEVMNVGIRKLKLAPKDVRALFELLKKRCEIKTITCMTIEKALGIQVAYGFSYFDSLLIASALEQNCQTLYSEDLQPDQVIESVLTIKNPFSIPSYQ